MNKYIAVDIGGTAVKYGVVAENGDILYHGKLPTEARKGGEALMEKVTGIVRGLRAEHETQAIGISSAGVIDAENGKVLLANDNLPGWQGMEIKKRLEDAFSVPVAVENDVNCVALGENWLGAGKDLHNFVCVALGTGVGGGIVLNNRIYRGYHYRAAEVGCLRMFPQMSDYLECNASTAALVKKISEKEGNTQIDGEYIFEQVRAKNDKFVSMLAGWALKVAAGLADVIYLLDPQAIILGGGVSGSPDILLPVMRDALGQYLRPGFGCELRVTTLGNDAGMLGAVYPFVV